MSQRSQVSVHALEFLKKVSAFAESDLLPLENEDSTSERFPEEIIEKMHDLGVFKAAAPRLHGGLEMRVTELANLIRILSYGSPSCAATFIGNLLGYSAVLLYAEDSLREKLSRDWMKEKSLWSFGMTEGRAGSDLMNIETVARRTKSGFVLNGEKNFITNASHSKRLVIFARLLSEDGKDEGISCFFVPGDAKGLKRGQVMTKIGWKRANTATLIFENVELAKENLLGDPGQGLRILTHCLNRSKTLLAAMGVGIAERALHLCNERLGSTERFKKSLLEQPAIRHILARLHTEKEAAWLLTLNAATTWDEGQDATKESSMAKLYSGGMAVKVCSQAMELFGARGLFHDFEVSRLISDSKCIEIIEGPSLVQELLIARAVLPKAKAESKSGDVYVLKKSDLKKAS